MNAINIVGNLTDAPELRQTNGGSAVANFRVAYTPRTFDKATQEWTDGDPLFLSCAVWHKQAENFAASAKKGDRVVVVGRLKPNNWEAEDGSKRSSIEVDVEEVGFSTRFKTVTVDNATSKSAKSDKSKTAKTTKAAKAAQVVEVEDDEDDDDEF